MVLLGERGGGARGLLVTRALGNCEYEVKESEREGGRSGDRVGMSSTKRAEMEKSGRISVAWGRASFVCQALPAYSLPARKAELRD